MGSGGKGPLALGQVALASQKTGDGDVLVERLPMQATAADAELFALFRAGLEEAWKPGQRHGDDSAVAEIDPHAVLIEMHPRCFNGRIQSKPLRCAPG